ncbi:MAG: hypothetical protein ABIL12_03805 [candidate division WOR-3 bacterium]
MVKKVLPVVILAVIFAYSCKKRGEGGSGGGEELPYPILVEQVTNYQCTPCKGANEVIDSLADAHPDKIFPIRYHVNTPYPGDPLNNEYADSMVSFHGLDLSRGVPITLIGGDFVDYGYDDNQRADYVQRWYNRIKEKSQTQPYYNPTVELIYGDGAIDVSISLDKPLQSGDNPKIFLSEYNVPLPPGSEKPYSNYALRGMINGTGGTFVVDTAWDVNNLYVIFAIFNPSKRVVGLSRVKVSNTSNTFTFYATDPVVDTIDSGAISKFHLYAKNNTNKDLVMTLMISGVPRFWNTAVCWGICISGNRITDTLHSGEETGFGTFYFSITPTTKDSANITAEFFLSDKPHIKRSVNFKVYVR